MSEGVQGQEARLLQRARNIEITIVDTEEKEKEKQRLAALQRGSANATVRVAAVLAELEGIRNLNSSSDAFCSSSAAATPNVSSYTKCLANSLAVEDSEKAVAELNRICEASCGCDDDNHFWGTSILLAYFLSELLYHILLDEVAENEREHPLSSNFQPRIRALQVFSEKNLATSVSTTSTFCSALYLTFERASEEGLLADFSARFGRFILRDTIPESLTTAASVALNIFDRWIDPKSKLASALAEQTFQRLIVQSFQLKDNKEIRPLTISTLSNSAQLTLSIDKKFELGSDYFKRAREIAANFFDMSSAGGDHSVDLSSGSVSGMANRLSPAGIDVGIVNVLADLGPACTQSVSALRDTLREVTINSSILNGGGSSLLLSKPNSLNETLVARLIWFFAERGSRKNSSGGLVDSSAFLGILANENDFGDGAGWILENVSQLLKEDYSQLDWDEIGTRLDFNEFYIRDASHLTSLLALYRSGAGKPFSSSQVLTEWRNYSGQLSFIETALSVPASVFTFPLNDAESADAATVADGSLSNCPNPHGWASASVLQRLLFLSDIPVVARKVRDLFVKGLLTCPEVLLCALVRLQLSVASAAHQGKPVNANVGMQMKGELMRELIPLFFKPNPHHRVQNGPAALRRLWSISPNTVAAACIEAWRSTASDSPQTRLNTIIHVISIIRLFSSPENAIATILNSNKDSEFSVAVAFIMADNDLLQLRTWLSERLSSGGGMFIVGLIAYLGKYFSSALPRMSSAHSSSTGTSLVTMENLALSLQFLQSMDNSILAQQIPNSLSSGDTSSSNLTIGDSVKALVDACLTAHPSLGSVITRRLVTSVPSGGASTPPPPSGSSDDIEEMANSYFQKIYTSEQSIGEVVEMLKRFKTSGNVRENENFACMIHNLFDEYRFFSKYPEKELRITGVLFGMLIQHQLVSSITLGIALRYVLEALRKPPSPPGASTLSSGKMFRFGMFALEQFKERLHEWPQYCSHIVQIPHLKEGYAQLVSEIEGAMAESQNRNSSEASAGGANSDANSVVSERSSNSINESQKPFINVPSSVDVRLNPPAIVVSGSRDQSQIRNGLAGGLSTPSNIELTPAALPLTAKHPQYQSQPKAVAIFGPGLGRAVNGKVDAGEALHDAPPDSTLDRVQFLINNVTMSNVEQKAKELKEVLAPKYFGWLGHYLVVKRISTQPNFHSVYLAFLDHLGDYGKGLVEAILSSVYLNVGKLLRSPKITTSTSERSLLKNLGSWLGQITLARNRPILQIMLDCKELLFQGYETGMLIAVTPFVAKILEGAKNSVVFKPPNPWLMGLLSVFRALYGVDDLKMNIKFEVEVLCKNLGVKLEDIPLRTDELSKRIPPVKARNPDFNMKSSMAVATPSANVPSGASATSTNSQTHAVSLVSSALPSPDGKQNTFGLAPSTASGMALAATGAVNSSSTPFSSTTSSASATSSVGQDQQQTVIPNLAAYVTINSSLPQLFQQLYSGGSSANINSATLKRSVPIAVDRAIREIIQPVVERSVTIACITTKEIVTKDFAMESDEIKMRKAAQLMVANLAGSLALVTCREPLRASVSTHLRQLLLSSAGASPGGGSTLSSGSQLTDQEQNAIEQCVAICATDNLELGCMLIEKAATEKAVRDMDEALAPALSARKKHRDQTGQPFYDMSIFGTGSQRYPAALPEPLRPKPGGLRNDQLLVYEAFQRLPRQPTISSSQQTTSASVNSVNSGSASVVSASSASINVSNKGTSSQFSIDSFSTIAAKLDNAVSTLLSAAGPRAPEITLSMLPPEHEVKQYLSAAQRITSSASLGSLNTSEIDSLLAFAQSIFKRLYDLSLLEPLRLEAFVAMLEALNECCPQLGKDLAIWATYAPTESDAQRKLHRTILLLLLRSQLISVIELDEYLSKSMDSGRNVVWLEFTLLFVKTSVLERIANPNKMPKVMEILSNIAEGSGQYQHVAQTYRKPVIRLLEEFGNSSGSFQPKVHMMDGATFSGNAPNTIESRIDKPTHQQSSSISAASLTNLAEATKRASEAIEIISRDDPPTLKPQVTFLLDSWMRIQSEIAGNEKALQYIQLLQQHGIGKNEEQTERFFRVSTELVVEAVLKNSSPDQSKGLKKNQGKLFNYGVIDAYANLVALLIRYMNSGGSSEQMANQRISLLNKVLGVTVRTMMANYEKIKKEKEGFLPHWDQRPWFRLLLNLVIDLNSPSPILDPISYGILSVFGSAFHVVQPLVIPGFAFAWLELISHRMFLSNLLLVKGQKGWALAHQLLIDLFLFLEPHLRKIELTDAMKHMYKGTLRVLLVLLHDFPAFLAGYHLSFCNVIPENCIQLRNLILSAFPRGMVLPDPFTPNLKIDLLPEISKSPVVLSNVAGPLSNMRSDLDSYLKSRQPSNFINNLLSCLYKDGSKDVDAPRVNSLVLYVGIQAILRLQNSPITHALAHTPEMEILQKLMDFDNRGRYVSLNALANQLRYPSSHTHYYSCVMLYLFSEAKDEGVKEQITRVLLERLIVHRPHPWGLLITFIELIKNQRYQFWSHPFTRCATEIEKVFESVARSCMTPGSQRSVAAGGDMVQ